MGDSQIKKSLVAILALGMATASAQPQITDTSKISIADTLSFTDAELDSSYVNTYGGSRTLPYLIADTTIVNIQNEGYYVSRKEPTLSRFVRSIVDSDDTREVKYQRLLDFVTEKIGYSHILGDDEPMDLNLRYSIQTLSIKNADCNGKTILYSSLLEQSRLEYVIVYLPHHMTVAIPGNFSDTNSMGFMIDGKKYYFAETTTPGFKIGITELNESDRYSIDDVELIQFMGEHPFVYDMMMNRILTTSNDKSSIKEIRLNIKK